MATTTLPLTAETYAKGYTWQEYLSGMKNYGAISQDLYESAVIPEELLTRFAELVKRHGGALSISAMTESWCGDSAVTLPFVARLADGVPGMSFRVFVGKENPELKEAYTTDGYESIPMLSFFDSSWSEIGRWMERPESANPRVDAWVADRPRIAELYGKDDPAAKAELKSIFAGLVTEMAGWYRESFWREMLTEFEKLLA